MPVTQVVVQQPAPPLPPETFDPNFFVGAIVPLVGVVVVAIAVALVLKALFRSPLGEALAERVREGSKRRRHWRGWGGEWLDAPAGGTGGAGAAGAGADEQRVAALEDQVAVLAGQVSELAERVDFAERLLAERREQRLGAGREPR